MLACYLTVGMIEEDTCFCKNDKYSLVFMMSRTNRQLVKLIKALRGNNNG
jgi:hypothetical protein